MALVVTGDERVDEYAWLRDASDPALVRFLRDERDRANSVLGDSRGVAGEYADFLGRHFAPARPREFSARGVQFRWRGSRLERRGEARGRWRTVFDTESYGASGGGGGVTNVAVSPDGRTLAITLHRFGTERWMLRFRDVERGRDLGVTVDEVGVSAAWLGNDRVLVSRVDATGRPASIHVFDLKDGLGPPLSVRQHITTWLSIRQLEDGMHALVAGEDLWLAGPETTTELTRVDRPIERSVAAGISYCTARNLLVMHLQPDEDVETLHVAPVADGNLGSWSEIFCAESAETIEGITAHEDTVIAVARQQGVPSILLVDYDGGPVHRIGIADGDVATTVALDETAAPSTSSSAHIVVRTPVDPGLTYVVETQSGGLAKQEDLVGPYRWKSTDYVNRVDWVRSDDGVDVPMTIVHRADLRVPAPTILYGYGSYGTSSRSTPNTDAMFWLSRGWVLATAHVRGGGELGPSWHRAGRREFKARSIADFVACAQHLVSTNTATPAQLAARGASAGGLLVCAAAIERPALFAAVVAHNPVTDVIEFLSDHSSRLAGPSIKEFGDIFNHPEVYEAVKRYNPYDNATADDYPAFLFTTGRQDERVPWWHAARLALHLRALTTGDRPIVLDVRSIGGHTGGSEFGANPADRAAAFLTTIIG